MTAVPASAFSALLRQFRLRVALTQEELADRSGLTEKGISALERGVRLRPHRHTLNRLADALQLSEPERAAFETAARRSRQPGSETRLHTASPPALVGRAAELQLLDHHLAGNGPPLLLATGEPGIGKSRLLAEAATRARAAGFAVLQGGCQRHSGQEPFAPIAGALACYVEEQPADRVSRVLQGCGWLVRLLPELLELVSVPLPMGVLPPEQERRLVFAAASRFLANVAGPAGTLLVVDDLHWAGRDALDLLTSMLQVGGQVPLRVIGSYRQTDVEPESPLALALADLAERNLAQHVRLGPLTPEEAAQLLAEILDETERPLGERIIQRSGGVPFFLVSCAQGLGTSGDAVPWNVAQSIRQRVAVLPPAAREIMGVTAIAGRVVAHDLLSTVVEQSEQRVIDALEVVCRTGLMVDEGRQGYRFAHDVVREVIEGDMGTARRTALHRRLVDALESVRGTRHEAGGRTSADQIPGAYAEVREIPELAWHAFEGHDTQRALRYALLAGEQAEAVFAHGEAERYYCTALQLLRTGDTPPLPAEDALGAEAGVLASLGRVIGVRGRYDEAIALLEQAAAAYHQAGDWEAEGLVVAQIGWVHAKRGSPEEGAGRIQGLLGPLERRGPTPSLAALHAALGRLLFTCGRYDDGLQIAERGSDLARAVADDGLLVVSELSRGMALTKLERPEEALQVFDAVILQAESVGDLDSLRIALTFAAVRALYAGKLDRSRAYLEQARAVAEHVGYTAELAFALGMLGDIHWHLGEWTRARDLVEQAVALFHTIDTAWLSAYPLLQLGRLCVSEGRWEEAARHLEESRSIARRSQDLQALRHGQAFQAELDLLEGRPGAALSRMQPLLDRPGQQEEDVTLYLWLVAWAQLELGDSAETIAEESVSRATRQHLRIALAPALRIQGMALSRQCRWDEAERVFDRAIALSTDMAHPYAEANALYEAGLMYARKEEPERARAPLERALAIFRRLGAQPYVERAERVLAQLGGP